VCVLNINAYSLFNDAFSVTRTVSNERVMNDELERMWKEVIVAKFKVLSRHFFNGATAQSRPWPPLLRFLNLTHGRTPLDE
jgi:hypothetical protein